MKTAPRFRFSLDEILTALNERYQWHVAAATLTVQASLKAHTEHIKAYPHDFEDNLQLATWLTSHQNWHRINLYAAIWMLQYNHSFITWWKEKEKRFLLDAAIDTHIILLQHGLRDHWREREYQVFDRGDTFEDEREKEIQVLEALQDKLRQKIETEHTSPSLLHLPGQKIATKEKKD